MTPLRAAIGLLQLNIVSARVSLAIPRDDRARNAPSSAPKLTASRALDLKIGSNHWRLRRRIGSLQSGKAIEQSGSLLSRLSFARSPWRRLTAIFVRSKTI